MHLETETLRKSINKAFLKETGDKVKDPVGVLLEVKRPANRNEMITDTGNWFVFDAQLAIPNTNST